MSEPTTKEEAKAAIASIMREARGVMSKAEDIADKFGITIYDEPVGVYPSLIYKPTPQEGSDWASSEDWESSSQGWQTSSANC